MPPQAVEGMRLGNPCYAISRTGFKARRRSRSARLPSALRARVLCLAKNSPAFKKNRQYHDGNLFVGGRRDLPRLDCRKDERSRVHSLERRSDTGKITEKCSKQR